MMILVEVPHLRFDLRSILHRLSDPYRKIGLVFFPTMGAAFGLGLVFSDFYLDFGQIENVALLEVAGFPIFQSSVTMDALPAPMHFDAVRIGCHFQSMPGMSWLTTAFP